MRSIMVVTKTDMLKNNSAFPTPPTLRSLGLFLLFFYNPLVCPPEDDAKHEA